MSGASPGPRAQILADIERILSSDGVRILGTGPLGHPLFDLLREALPVLARMAALLGDSGAVILPDGCIHHPSSAKAGLVVPFGVRVVCFEQVGGGLAKEDYRMLLREAEAVLRALRNEFLACSHAGNVIACSWCRAYMLGQRIRQYLGDNGHV